jgi:uncharacterized protein YyaL (SSP411 family)
VIHSVVDADLIKSSVQHREGFLDDYASIIEGLIAVYQITFDEKYLMQAKSLCETVMHQFSSEGSPLFYFTSATAEKLIKRSMELQDNVIPSSNAMMAMNLYLLSRYFDNATYLHRAEQMIALMQKEISNALPWYCKWAQVKLYLENSKSELVVSGPDAQKWIHAIQQHFKPNLIFAIASENSILPLCKNRFNPKETVGYYCENNNCSLPITDFESLSLVFN